MTMRVLRANYYWPSLRVNCVDFVKRWKNFQEHGPLLYLHPHDLQNINSPWTFALWGMDIVRPFLPALGKENSCWWQ